MRIGPRPEQGSRKTKARIGLASYALLCALCISAQAQPAAKIAHIGFLDTSTASASALRFKDFWKELDRLGWIQGKNLTVEYRFADKTTHVYRDLWRIYFAERLISLRL